MEDVGLANGATFRRKYTLPHVHLHPSLVDLHRQEHGLQDSPLGDVTLKCDKKQEAASYPDVDGHFEATTELARICHVVPVHIIWGGSSDLVCVHLLTCH